MKPAKPKRRDGKADEGQLEKTIVKKVMGRVEPQLNRMFRYYMLPGPLERPTTPVPQESKPEPREKSNTSGDKSKSATATPSSSQVKMTSKPSDKSLPTERRSILDWGFDAKELRQSVYRHDFTFPMPRPRTRDGERERRQIRQTESTPGSNILAPHHDPEVDPVDRSALAGQGREPEMRDACVTTTEEDWPHPGYVAGGVGGRRGVFAHPDHRQHDVESETPSMASTVHRPREQSGQRKTRLSSTRKAEGKHRTSGEGEVDPIYSYEYGATFSPTRAAYKCPQQHKLATIDRGRRKSRRVKSSLKELACPKADRSAYDVASGQKFRDPRFDADSFSEQNFRDPRFDTDSPSGQRFRDPRFDPVSPYEQRFRDPRFDTDSPYEQRFRDPRFDTDSPSGQTFSDPRFDPSVQSGQAFRNSGFDPNFPSVCQCEQEHRTHSLRALPWYAEGTSTSCYTDGSSTCSSPTVGSQRTKKSARKTNRRRMLLK